jgi:hypothetical protein
VGADGRRVIFVLNHAGQTHNLSLAQPIVDVLTDQRHERSLHLKAHQVVVFVEPPHA